MDDSTPTLPGTLDLLILKAVSLGTLHGYGVLLRIQPITGGALQIFPALLTTAKEMRTSSKSTAIDGWSANASGTISAY